MAKEKFAARGLGKSELSAGVDRPQMIEVAFAGRKPKKLRGSKTVSIPRNLLNGSSVTLGCNAVIQRYSGRALVTSLSPAGVNSRSANVTSCLMREPSRSVTESFRDP